VGAWPYRAGDGRHTDVGRQGCPRVLSSRRAAPFFPLAQAVFDLGKAAP